MEPGSAPRLRIFGAGTIIVRKVSEYEQHAKEYRQMASNMRDPTRKQQLEEMAVTWTMLAKERSRQLEKQANATPAHVSLLVKRPHIFRV